MSKLRVGNILDINPLDIELSLPLVLGPQLRPGLKVNTRDHLSTSAKLPGTVHREEKIDRTAATSITSVKSLVKARISGLGRAPYAVLDAVHDVVFRVRLDDEEAGELMRHAVQLAVESELDRVVLRFYAGHELIVVVVMHCRNH